MISKGYLEKITAEEFPDLKNTRFMMNHQALGLFTENTLLPLLVFQNTTDSKNRLISLYLAPDSPGMHLLPFYIALGFYRKAANKALNAQDFYNTPFQPNTRQVVVNGAVCSVTSVDYLSQCVLLHGGNRYFGIPFSEDYKIRWQYSNAHGLRDSIARFQRIQKASSGNIFSLQLKEGDKSHEGLIIFTQPSRFEALLGNITISGSSLKEHLNIQKTVFSEHDIKMVSISLAKTKKMPVSVLVSRPDTLFAYDNIIHFGGEQFRRLRTIVIEDFDLLLKSWERSGQLSENIGLLDETYFQRLGSLFRDIYLVCSNRNFDVQDYLAGHGIKPMAWMLKAQETRQLEQLSPARDIQVDRTGSPETDQAVVDLENLISEWKSMAVSYFCGGEILGLVKMLYHNRTRLRSFYHRESFNATLASQQDFFLAFRSKWFPAGQDHGMVENTQATLGKIAEANYGLSALVAERIGRELEGQRLKKLVLVSRNQSPEDRQHLCFLLGMDAAQVAFMDEKTFLDGRQQPDDDSLTVFLGASKALVDMLLTDSGDSPRLLLADGRGYGYLSWYVPRAQTEINKISPTAEKCELLNLPAAQAALRENPAPVRFVFCGGATPSPGAAPETVDEEEEAVRAIVWEVVEKNGLKQTQGENYLVFFEDGSQLGFQQHQSLFLYQENGDTENDELEREVKNLRMGDQVIVPKNRTGIRKLLSDALAGHENYSRAVYYDLKWRNGILDFINLKGDIYHFMAILNAKGLPIAVPDTIRKWIDGETLQPNYFMQLILVLVELGIIEDHLKDEYFRESRELKRIKSRFIKSAILRLIYTFRNISHGLQEAIFDDRLLDSFIDHVEVKTVLTVVAK